MIKDKRLSNQLIEKVPMTSNHLFPLRIIPDTKGKTNTRAAFKEKIKEVDKHFDKKENGSVDFQVSFQTKVKDESWLWQFIFGNMNFGGMKLLHIKNMVKGFPLIDKPERVCEGCILTSSMERIFHS